MKLFKKNKKAEEVKKDENGEVIDLHPEKAGKKILKKVAIGLGAAAVGFVTFCAVGVAMAYSSDDSSCTTEPENGETDVSDDGYSDSADGSATENTGTEE